MDESDLFAELDALTSSTSKPVTSSSTTTSAPVDAGSNKALEDELFELLNATTSSVVTPARTETAANNDPKPVVSSGNMDEDFLSWLEETPKKTPSQDTKTISIAPAAGQAKKDEPSIQLPASTTSTNIQDTSIDSFLNDVLNSSPSGDVKTPSSLENVVLTPTETQGDIRRKQLEYERELEAIVDSPYPDLGLLRSTLDKGGYLPLRSRLKILVLLLTGSCHIDEEALNFSATTNEKLFFIDLVSDCEALIKANHYQHESILIENISDVVYLYCQRRSLDYKNVYSRIMLSILGTNEDISKSLLSTCFYCLSSNFLPLVGLQYTALDLATEAVHFWLRLLVTYHCPLLAQHLDRVTPGWEKCSKETTSQQTVNKGNLIKGSNKLDLLEKELGIDMAFDFDSEVPVSPAKSEISNPATPSGKIVESASPKHARKGLIPTNWITSFFSGSVPPSESAKLLDWSVFNGERFAGIYFLTSLLELNSEVLLKMNAQQLSQWFENIEANKENWFHSCTFKLKKDSKEFSCKDLTWEQFTNCWIQTTASLIGNTPKAFRDSLPRTETWAILAAERQQQFLSNQVKSLLSKNNKSSLESGGGLLDEQLHGNNEGNKNNKIPDAFDNSDSESDSDSDDNNDLGNNPTGGNNNNKNMGNKTNSSLSILMNQLRTIAASQFDEDDHGFDASFDETSEFAQDQKLKSDTLCLWSSVEEVLPCICSNIRRARHDEFELKEIFYSTYISLPNSNSNTNNSEASSSKNKSCFFISSIDTMTPLYFAIDCRKNEEKTIGLFPKAYSLDPDIIYDSDGLTELLAILQPIASTTHIVIIGSGLEYYRWFIYKFKYANRKKKTKPMKKEYKELIEEDSKKINAIAMILIKKGFKFISVLQGGFAEAAQYIHRPESKLNLSSALVDIDKVKLYSLLDIPYEVPKASLTSRLEMALSETPAALKTVGSLINTWRNPKPSDPPAAASTTTAPPSQAPAAAIPAPPAATVPVTDSNPPAAPPAAVGGEANNNTSAAAKQLLSGFGKSLSLFGQSSLENIKKGISSVAAKAEQTTAEKQSSQPPSHEQDDGMGPDPNKISLNKTEQERVNALAIHRMSGLKKGDQITISRAELPGAILFPCTKIKDIWVVPKNIVAGEASTENPAVEKSVSEDKKDNSQDEADLIVIAGAEEEGTKKGPNGETLVKQQTVVSRYLVVSRERFMVLDANGAGVGAVATVKSNHHLTELLKMTFRKKDPEVVSLFIVGSTGEQKVKQYRVPKYKEFITTLQKHMERFK